jgi:hypothetical protein
MISILKVIGVVFALLMAYSTFLNFKKKEFSKIQLLFWESVWLCLMFIVFFTNTVTVMVKSIGFLRLMDFLTVMGFVVIIFLSFNNYSSITKMKFLISYASLKGERSEHPNNSPYSHLNAFRFIVGMRLYPKCRRDEHYSGKRGVH